MDGSNNPAVQSNSGVKKQKWGRVFPPLFLKGQEMRPLPFQKQKNSRPITIQDGRKPANMAQEITSKYLPGVYIGKGPGEEGYALPPRRHALQFYHGGGGVSHPFFFSYGSAVSRCGAAFYVPNGGVRLYSRFSRAYRQVSVQMGAPASSR